MSKSHSYPAPDYLQLQGLTKVYGERNAVSDLNLSVARGELVSLLGPSGCGKTTTLHMIAGFHTPDEGDIVLDGCSLRNVPGHRRGAAMVFQNYALFPHMTVHGNVEFGLKMAGVSGAERRRRVGDAVELVRLGGLENRYPRELSGGQQQRVALARALVLKPSLLLLDEPLSNLDPSLRRALRQELVDIHRLTGMTTVLVTHDLEEAFAVSDRIAVLNQGVLDQFDTPRAIYTRPKTRFVADFLGHENVLEGRRISTEGTARVDISGTLVEAPSPRPDLVATELIRYALPARQLHIVAPSNESSIQRHAGRSRFGARVKSLAFMGSAISYSVDWQGLVLQGEQTADALFDGLEVGAAVDVSWATDHLIELPNV